MILLRRNLGYRLLAVFAAALLYGIANNQQPPHTTKPFSTQPLLINAPDNLVIKTAPQQIMGTIAGTPTDVEAFRSVQNKATIDLSGATTGTHSFPIQYPPAGGTLEISAPSSVQITLARRQKATFTVDPLYKSSPPAGYVYGDPVITPKNVEVDGGENDVRKVARVVAVIDNAGEPGAFTVDALLVAQDSHSQRVEGVTLTPSQVRVATSQHRALATKAVALSADFSDTPAPGVVLRGYHFTPGTLSLSGSLERLVAISSLRISVSVRGVTQSQERTVVVSAPNNLSFADGTTTQAVRLHLDAEPFARIPGATPHSVPASMPPPAIPSSSPSAPVMPTTTPSLAASPLPPSP